MLNVRSQGLILQQERKLLVSRLGTVATSTLQSRLPLPLISTCLVPFKEFLHEVNRTMCKWLKTQSKDFYVERIQKLIFQWEKFDLRYIVKWTNYKNAFLNNLLISQYISIKKSRIKPKMFFFSLFVSLITISFIYLKKQKTKTKQKKKNYLQMKCE